MRTSTEKNSATFNEAEALARLDIFDHKELLSSLEFDNRIISHRLSITIDAASQLMKEAKIQLESENITFLEYAVHKLRGIFTTIGCQRLAFLFEKMYWNLTKVKIDYLRDLFYTVNQEFVFARKAIADFLKTTNGVVPHDRSFTSLRMTE